jgi:hypothetical protein
MMCGNINQSPKFKNYAVTMFEVGKISEEEMDDFLSELEKVDDSLIYSEVLNFWLLLLFLLLPSSSLLLLLL